MGWPTAFLIVCLVVAVLAAVCFIWWTLVRY